MKVNFSPPDISQSEIDEVIDTLKSGWITTGPKTKKLESQLAEYIGVNKCVCLNSQTACQELALRLTGIGEGDEVITTAYTYTASASVVCHVGAKLILIDTQPNSLEMDYEQLRSNITSKTKAIIPVDIAGIPCDYNRIFEIVNEKRSEFIANGKMQKALGRIAVMADCAHSLGAQYCGKMVGSVADFSSFSFHAVKNLTTAEGGALAWNALDGISDDEIYHQLQLFSLHGQSKDAFSKTQVGAWEYDVIGTWYKCNMTDVAASIGLAQLKRYSRMLDRRKAIIEKYNEVFELLGISVLPHYTNEHFSSGHLYITRVPNVTAEQRNEIIVKMAEIGIMCNVHYKPLPMHTAYKELGFNIDDYPNAHANYKNAITLPLHTCLNDDEVEYVIRNYSRIVREYI